MFECDGAPTPKAPAEAPVDLGPGSMQAPKKRPCFICGAKSEITASCSWCWEYFCSAHFEQENHSCISLPNRREAAGAVDVEESPADAAAPTAAEATTPSAAPQLQEQTQPRGCISHTGTLPPELRENPPVPPDGHRASGRGGSNTSATNVDEDAYSSFMDSQGALERWRNRRHHTD